MTPEDEILLEAVHQSDFVPPGQEVWIVANHSTDIPRLTKKFKQTAYGMGFSVVHRRRDLVVVGLTPYWFRSRHGTKPNPRCLVFNV